MIEGTPNLDGIAIIGMSGRFPQADSIDTFWRNLCAGVEAITFFSDEQLLAAGIEASALAKPSYVKAAPCLGDVGLFDAAFFGYSPREAAILDPQQRLFLECAWAALEHAGYDPGRYGGAIGVFGSTSVSGYLLNNILFSREFAGVGRNGMDMENIHAMIANDKDYLATRIAYKLNLRGPAISVQTACSSSLVAAHLACQSLLNGESDMALAGGISLKVPQEAGYFYQEGGMVSPDGHCRAFDSRAGGTIFGSGMGIVVLKRLEDAIGDGDTIYAVIRGSAINNDGSLKISYTAPSVDAQAAVIREALEMADISADTVGYVEAHGTGTPLGDPVEIAALTEAFRTTTSRRGFCGIGSVKTNIGHLDAASGIANLIKAVLILQHGQIPPSLHFEQINPRIDLDSSPFYVNTQLTEWPRGPHPRRAGVSSLGAGGTNAHVVLEEAPAPAPSSHSRPQQLLCLSAKTRSALDSSTAQLAAHLRQYPEQPLPDIAYTLQLGRAPMPHRRTLVGASRDEVLALLENSDPKRILTQLDEQIDRSVVFMFSGQGAQYPQMGYGLYQSEPIFRAAVDRCAATLRPLLGLDLRELIYTSGELPPDATLPGPPTLDATWLAQPALFTIEYALAQLWMAWGVRPQAMIGHSIGEYVAACLAGVFSLDDALALVAARGRLMQRMPAGAMLSIPLPAEELRATLSAQLDLATINEPGRCVVAGPHDEIAALEQQLGAAGLQCRRLHTSHAFHSAMMDPILPEFVAYVRRMPLHAPRLPYISNVSGTWISAAQATDPAYWGQQLRQTVLFAAGLGTLLADPGRVLLELGPGQSLSSAARRQATPASGASVLASLRHPQDQDDDSVFLLAALGRIWMAGVAIDWPGFYAAEQRRRVPLPSYPFERQRYWIAPSLALGPGAAPDEIAPPDTEQPAAPAPAHTRPSLPNDYVAPRSEVEQALAAIWQDALGIAPIGVHDNFFDLGGDSVLGVQIAARATDRGLRITPKQLFERNTIADLAQGLAASAAPQAEQGPVVGPAPLTPIQRWFFEQQHPEIDRFGIGIPLELLQPIEIDQLTAIFQHIFDHHDTLRMRYSHSAGIWEQHNASPHELYAIREVSLGGKDRAEQDQAFLQLQEELQSQLNIASGPLFTITLVHMGANQPKRLIIMIHHLIWDFGTERILLSDFMQAYQQVSQGHAIQLPLKTSSYKQWGEYLATFARSETMQQEIAYWCSPTRQQSAPLPRDYPEDQITADSISLLTSTCEALSAAQTSTLLQEVQRTYRIKIEEILLAALLKTLTRWAGTTSIHLQLDSTGRDLKLPEIDLSNTMGWFTTTFPVLLELRNTTTPNQLLKAVKEQIRAIPYEGIGYGLLRYIHPDKDIRQQICDLPQPEIFFYHLGYQNMPDLDLFRYCDGALRQARDLRGSQECPLEIRSRIDTGQLQIDWIYSSSVYRHETIASLAQEYMLVFQELINPSQHSNVPAYTPSDFPLAGVSQAELDAVLLEFADIDA